MLLLYRLVFQMVEAFVFDAGIEKRFQGIDMIEISSFFPAGDKYLLDHIFNNGRVHNVFIPESSKSIKIVIKEGSESTLIPPVNMLNTVFIQMDLIFDQTLILQFL